MAGVQGIRPANNLYDPFSAAERGRTRRVNEAGADFLETAARAATTVVGQMVPAVTGMALGSGPLGVAGAAGGGALGGMGSGIDPMKLLMAQEQLQQQSQAFQTASNISKTEHDSKMNAVRNLRAG